MLFAARLLWFLPLIVSIGLLLLIIDYRWLLKGQIANEGNDPLEISDTMFEMTQTGRINSAVRYE